MQIEFGTSPAPGGRNKSEIYNLLSEKLHPWWVQSISNLQSPIGNLQLLDNDISDFKVNQMANTDLVTYYGQTEKIDQLVEKHGAYLEQLDRKTKLLLRTTLSQYVFMQQICTPDNYLVTEALKDVDFERFLYDGIPKVLINLCSELNGLTVDDAETILEALQHQLRWGNARLLTIQ